MNCIRATMAFAALLSTAEAANNKRPSMLNTNTTGHSFGCRGHQSTIDGRIFVGTPFGNQNAWQASAFRPESITYEVDGKPNLEEAFSEVKRFENNSTTAKGSGFGICVEDLSWPFTMQNNRALYRNFIIDSPHKPRPRMLGRRVMELQISQPFTKQAEVHSFHVGELTQLRSTAGETLHGYEPTLTADGRLMVFKSPDRSVPSLMYTYNSNPCSVAGWSPPRPLNWMHLDPNPGLQKYPLSWNSLRAADGMVYDPWRTTSDFARPRSPLVLFGGAYPWLDHAGRNLVYVDSDEIVSMIGADTKWTAYNMDGAINGERYDRKHKFYSGPMWRLEKERAQSMNFPPGRNNKAHYLPVTKGHDVMPLFGSNPPDYNEVDVSELTDPFHLISLPMNELRVYNADRYSSGVYDLSRTPDLSGHFYTGDLLGHAQISSFELTQSSKNSTTHGKGKAIIFQGGGAVRARLSDEDGTVLGVGRPLGSLTVQFMLRPDKDIIGCKMERYIVKKDTKLGIIYEENANQLHFLLEINGVSVNLGPSPPLLAGQWSHVAYTWDGTSGIFNEYVNGRSTARKSLPVVPGIVQLGEGNLFLGSADEHFGDTADCQNEGRGSFRGAMDEFAIFTHARSARSICASAHGADCEREASLESPSRPFSMTAEAPTCTGPEQLDTVACQSAIHRGCAERGVRGALSSGANLQGTITQLISNRPPVPLAGVPVASTSDNLTVGCIPISHQSVAVEFDWLARVDSSCVHEDTIMGINCTIAINQFCNSLGWTTGQLFEMTSRPWVSCFNSDLREQVEIGQFGVKSGMGDLSSPASRLETSQWCITKGYGAGLIQDKVLNETVSVHCFHPSVSVTWPYLSENPFMPRVTRTELSPNAASQPSSTSQPSGGRGSKKLRMRSETGPPLSFLPLAECEGDCDGDADCDMGLVCLQRDRGGDRSVPGCTGSDGSRTDYCIRSELRKNDGGI